MKYFWSTLLIFIAFNLEAQRLNQKELVLYDKNYVVTAFVGFENDSCFLFLSAPSYQYRCNLSLYRVHDRKIDLYQEKNLFFSDSVTQIWHKIPLGPISGFAALELKIQSDMAQTFYHQIFYENEMLPSSLLMNYLDGKTYWNIENRFIFKKGREQILLYNYSSKLEIAPPPYSSRDGKLSPDSFVFQFKFDQDTSFYFENKGLYRLEDSQGKYCNFLVVDGSFPTITTVNSLVQLLRYISKNEEYVEMLNAENKKSALDKFWLERNKNQIEAKRLISLYYNRAKESNKFFSDMKEGWQTDRGMMYIVFGRPDMVRKSIGKEIWYYTAKNGRYPMEFVFLHTDGQWILNRYDKLRDDWNQEMFLWRSGKAK